MKPVCPRLERAGLDKMSKVQKDFTPISVTLGKEAKVWEAQQKWFFFKRQKPSESADELRRQVRRETQTDYRASHDWLCLAQNALEVQQGFGLEKFTEEKCLYCAIWSRREMPVRQALVRRKMQSSSRIGFFLLWWASDQAQSEKTAHRFLGRSVGFKYR